MCEFHELTMVNLEMLFRNVERAWLLSAFFFFFKFVESENWMHSSSLLTGRKTKLWSVLSGDLLWTTDCGADVSWPHWGAGGRAYANGVDITNYSHLPYIKSHWSALLHIVSSLPRHVISWSFSHFYNIIIMLIQYIYHVFTSVSSPFMY